MNSDHSTSKISDHDQFIKDELKVHTCAYVPHSELKMCEKSFNCKRVNLFYCLRYVAAQCNQTDYDVLHLNNYTKEWMDKVDHSGLFPLNDSTYFSNTDNH